ncbi:MAG TPA: hypothetical protein VMJ32_14425 [Pirellulales bacterium]|nr:hypothetical protein [Pirellulales bacterium]
MKRQKYPIIVDGAVLVPAPLKKSKPPRQRKVRAARKAKRR